jgi:hypothetical protein
MKNPCLCELGCAGCIGAVHAAVADPNDGIARDAAQAFAFRAYANMGLGVDNDVRGSPARC